MIRILVTLGVAIVAGAAALPVASVGIGWLVGALAALAVVVAARTARGTLGPVPPENTPSPVTPAAPGASGSAAPAASGSGAPTASGSAGSVASGSAGSVATPAPPSKPATGVSMLATAPPTVRTTPPTRGDRVWRYGAGACALLLVAVPTVRASVVVAFLCVTAALALGSYALVGGRTWAAVLAGGLSLIPGVALGARWLVGQRSRRSRPSGTSVGRVGLAVAATVMLVAVLIPLLRSADPVFAELLDSWTRYLPEPDLRAVAGALALAFIGIGGAYYAYRGPVRNRSSVEGQRPLRGLEWLLPIVAVNVIFAVFVVVQLNVLFGGHDYVLGAGGPDYAEYARGGFGQLVVVTMISLGLAAGLGGLVRRDTPRQRALIRVMGGLLCGLTMVIVASALKRMLLYVDVYGFTWLRILSFAGEVFLGLVFALLLVAGIRLRGAWLPRDTAAAAVAVLLALVAVNPEAVMARTSIEARQDGPYAVDLDFLDWLSADAVDEILRLPPGDRDCALQQLRADLREPDPWYEFNLARRHAREVLASVHVADCATDSVRSR